MVSERSKPKETRKLFFKHIVQKLFLEDWAMKLTALVITLGLWLGVTGLSTPTTKRITVPLNLSISSDAQIVNVPQPTVEIEISGDKRKIEQIDRAQLAVSVDLTGVLPGDRVVQLSPDTVSISLPQGVKLVDIAPNGIVVNLEAVEEKDIEVRVQNTGGPPAGYEVYDMTAIPSKIRVRGPASVVKVLGSVQTEEISLEGKKDSFTARQVVVSASDPKVAVLNTVVDVYFRIGEKRVERSFTVPISNETNKMASFSIYGPRSLLSKTRPEDINVEMELDDNGDEVPRVILPPDLQDLAVVRRLRTVGKTPTF